MCIRDRFLAAHPVSEHSKLHEDIPDEVFESNVTSEDEVWQIFFDGASRIGPKGKFQPKWEGPFVIETVYSNGAYRLMTSDGTYS